MRGGLSRCLVTAIAIATGSLVVLPAAQSQPPSGNGAARFADLHELNNKLGRSISGLESELTRGGSTIHDTAHWTRTLNDLEVTKLRAVDQFPDVFGLPYGETFRQLSCIDDDIAVGKIALHELEKGYPTRHFPAGKRYASRLVLERLKQAKDCKETLEVELSSGTNVPSGVSDDLRELNNKLGRSISGLESELTRGGSTIHDTAHWTRALNDLEVTKLRAVEQFPEILDPPYADIFRPLSCVDDDIAVGKIALHELEKGYLTSHFPAGKRYASRLVLERLKQAKDCKETLEVELMHPFDLKPSEQMEVGVNATTPNGTDTRNPRKLNAPKPLQHAYTKNGFIGRHERDYVAAGVDGAHPDSWPTGRNVLYFDVFDLFNTTKGARKVEKASEKSLKSKGFSSVADSSLGSGEKVFQLQPSGSPLLSTIIYVQRGPFILKIAGSCKGCARGSIESSLESLAQSQLAQAVNNGFPASGGGPASGACSGHAMLANIYGGQAHELVSDFTCPKTSIEFSLTVPSGYQITGGQASNAASSGGYSCSLNATNTTVDCTGNAPAASTTYVQMTTSPNPQAGMVLPLKVTFSDGSTTSFTLTSQ